MLYFVGEGETFNIKDCKKYKTLEGAVRAANKKENSTIWTETGDIVAPNGEKIVVPPLGKGLAISNTADIFEEIEENTIPEENLPDQKRKAIVICNCSLRVRRSPSWDEGNTCGLVSTGATFRVKDIIEVEGKEMIHTVDDLYISADPEHVRIEKL